MRTTIEQIEAFRDPCPKCKGAGKLLQTWPKDDLPCEDCGQSGKAEDIAIVAAAKEAAATAAAETLKPRSIPMPVLERLDSASIAKSALDEYLETSLAAGCHIGEVSVAEMRARFVEGRDDLSDAAAMLQFKEDMIEKSLEYMR